VDRSLSMLKVAEHDATVGEGRKPGLFNELGGEA